MTATSVADGTKSASSVVTLVPVAVTLTPPTAALSISQTQQFAAAVTGSANTSVSWSISPSGTGTISASGLYTAPLTIAASATVSVIATSAADATKTASATVTLTPVAITLAPATTTLGISQTQQFNATVTGSSNTAVTWALLPATGAGTISTAGLYTAPTSIAGPQTVTVTANSTADQSKSASASVTLNPVVVTIRPGSLTLSQNGTQQFSASAANTSNSAVTWSISPSGVGTITSGGLYTAPNLVTTPQLVTIIATSVADPAQSGSASVTLMPVSVTVTPSAAALQNLQTQQFNASVTNATNTGVTWSLTPSVGTITAAGLYTAPANMATSQTISVLATSVADPAQTGIAYVNLVSNGVITSILPNTVRAGEAVLVTITGQGSAFTSTTQITLGDATISLLTAANSNTLTALVTLPRSTTLGARDLVVTQGGVPISLAAAFTVTAPVPQITFLAPAPQSFTNTNPVTVRGAVSDPTATVIVNGIAASVSQGAFLATVPLVEGNNQLVASAQTPGGLVGTGSVSVTLDTTPPKVAISSPANGLITTGASIPVAGLINDIVVGTVNDQQATVKVNGVTATVANRAFLLSNVPLTLGNNTIQVVGADRSGNSATTSITVTRVAQTQAEIRIVSGSGQTGTILTQLAAPLVVTLVDSRGLPQAGKPVIFKVVQNNGSIDGGAATVTKFQNGSITQSVIVNTNLQGQASVNWTLGGRAGAGNNRVEATAAGFTGIAAFVASGTPSAATQINVDAGNPQTGAVNSPLAFPFVVVVSDVGHNRLGNVPVTFTVTKGSGLLGGAVTSVIQNTDSDGRALVTLTLGPQAGVSNNVVSASFVGNPGLPAIFAANAQTPGDPAQTKVSGVVLDNSNTPLANVTMRLYQPYLGQQNNVPIQVGPSVLTDATGQFLMGNVPVGRFKLMVDPSTTTRPGSWPTLEYDVVTVAGQSSTVGTPIYLVSLDTVNKLCVTATTGGTLTLPQVPGFALTVQPGSVTFPGGSQTGCVSVTPVHMDKVPMTPAFGQQFRFVVTIQPVGASFNTPASLTLPNVDGLKAREVAEMFSFDHDLNSFVSIGTATVSDDGQVVRTDAGVGVLKAGWHGLANPQRPGSGENLSLSVTPSDSTGSSGDTFTFTASGTPTDSLNYDWSLISTQSGDDPGAFQFISQPTCNGQSLCIASIKATRPGLASVQVTVTGPEGTTRTVVVRARAVTLTISKIWSDQYPSGPIANYVPAGAGIDSNPPAAYKNYLLMGSAIRNNDDQGCVKAVIG